MKKQFLIITITIIAASVAFAFVGNDKGEAGGSSAGMTSVLKMQKTTPSCQKKKRQKNMETGKERSVSQQAAINT